MNAPAVAPTSPPAARLADGLLVGLGRVAPGHAAGLALPPALERLRPLPGDASAEAWLRLAAAEDLWRQVVVVPAPQGQLVVAPGPAAVDEEKRPAGTHPLPPAAVARLRAWVHGDLGAHGLAERVGAWLVSAHHHACTGPLPPPVLAALARHEGSAQGLAPAVRSLLGADAGRLAWVAAVARSTTGRYAAAPPGAAEPGAGDGPDADEATDPAMVGVDVDPLGPAAARRFRAVKDSYKRATLFEAAWAADPRVAIGWLREVWPRLPQTPTSRDRGILLAAVPAWPGAADDPAIAADADAFLAAAGAEAAATPAGRLLRGQVLRLRATLGDTPWRRGIETRLATWLPLAPSGGVAATLTRLKGWFKGSPEAAGPSALALAPPAAFEPDWTTEGFEEFPPADEATKARPGHLFPPGPLDWLGQHVAALPPSVTAARLGLTPAGLLDAIDRGPLDEPTRGRLRQALAQAALLHRDAAGVEAAVAHWLAGEGAATGLARDTLHAMLGRQPPTRAAAIVRAVAGWPALRDEAGPRLEDTGQALDVLVRRLLQLPAAASREEIDAVSELTRQLLDHPRPQTYGWRLCASRVLDRTPYLPPAEVARLLALDAGWRRSIGDGWASNWLRDHLDRLALRQAMDQDFAAAGRVPAELPAAAPASSPTPTPTHPSTPRS